MSRSMSVRAKQHPQKRIRPGALMFVQSKPRPQTNNERRREYLILLPLLLLPCLISFQRRHLLLLFITMFSFPAFTRFGRRRRNERWQTTSTYESILRAHSFFPFQRWFAFDFCPFVRSEDVIAELRFITRFVSLSWLNFSRVAQGPSC